MLSLLTKGKAPGHILHHRSKRLPELQSFSNRKTLKQMKQDILPDECVDAHGCFLFKLNWGMRLSGNNTADTRTLKPSLVCWL